MYTARGLEGHQEEGDHSGLPILACHTSCLLGFLGGFQGEARQNSLR